MKLLTLVCMPLAVLLIIYNLVAYPSLVQSPRFVTPAASVRSRRLAAAAERAVAHDPSHAHAQQHDAHQHDVLAHGGSEDSSDGKATESDDAEADEAKAPESDDDRAAESDEARAAEESDEAKASEETDEAKASEETDEAKGEPAAKSEAEDALDEKHEPKDDGAAAAAGAPDEGGGLTTLVTAAVVSGANAAAGAVGRVASALRAAAGNADCTPKKPDTVQRPLNWVEPLESAHWPAPCAAAWAAGGLCREIGRVAKHREVVLVIAHPGDANALEAFASGAPEPIKAQLLVAALDDCRGCALRSVALGIHSPLCAEASCLHLSCSQRWRRRRARRAWASSRKSCALRSIALGIASAPIMQRPHVRSALPRSVPDALSQAPRGLLKYSVVAAVLAAGCSLVYADLRVSWSDAPFAYLHRDTDLEAVGGSGYLQFGRVVSVDDAQMGWSRYAQSLAIHALNPHLFYLSATKESVAFARKAAARMGALDAAASAAAEAYVLTDEAISPSHDGVRRAGISVRVLEDRCFGAGHGSVAAAPSTGGGASGMGNPNQILSSREFAAKPLVLRQGCTPVAAPPDDPPARPLNYVLPAGSAWPPRELCTQLEVEDLCATVARVAVNRIVLAAVSNKNIFHMLQLFVNGSAAPYIHLPFSPQSAPIERCPQGSGRAARARRVHTKPASGRTYVHATLRDGCCAAAQTGIKAANVRNGMVVALDDDTADWLKQRQARCSPSPRRGLALCRRVPRLQPHPPLLRARRQHPCRAQAPWNIPAGGALCQEDPISHGLDRQPRDLGPQVQDPRRLPVGRLLGAALGCGRDLAHRPDAVPLPRHGRRGDDRRVGRADFVRLRLRRRRAPRVRAQLGHVLHPGDA